MHFYIYVSPRRPTWREAGGLMTEGEVGVSRGKLPPPLEKAGISREGVGTFNRISNIGIHREHMGIKVGSFKERKKTCRRVIR